MSCDVRVAVHVVGNIFMDIFFQLYCVRSILNLAES